MPVRIEFSYDNQATPQVVRCQLHTNDSALVGQDATFAVVADYRVKDSRAIHSKETVYKREISLTGAPLEFDIPKSQLQAYSYRGQMLDIQLSCQLSYRDGRIFTQKINKSAELKLAMKPKVGTCASNLISPKDVFSLRKNFSAIPLKNKTKFLALSVVAAVVISVNTLVGVHDQFAPESQTYFYSHEDSDGDGQSPLFNSLAGSGALGFGVWLAMRRQLRQYMSFKLLSVPPLKPTTEIPAANLIEGVSRVELHDVTLRVVACNMECGQYERGSGTNQRTVSFQEPVNGVVLYSHTVAQIPAEVPIGGFFPGSIAFRPMFAGLYPPQNAKSSHGIRVHWEVQLLHPDFVDQELTGPTDGLKYLDFLQTGDDNAASESEDSYYEEDSGLVFELKPETTNG